MISEEKRAAPVLLIEKTLNKTFPFFFRSVLAYFDGPNAPDEHASWTSITYQPIFPSPGGTAT